MNVLYCLLVYCYLVFDLYFCSFWKLLKHTFKKSRPIRKFELQSLLTFCWDGPIQFFLKNGGFEDKPHSVFYPFIQYKWSVFCHLKALKAANNCIPLGRHLLFFTLQQYRIAANWGYVSLCTWPVCEQEQLLGWRSNHLLFNWDFKGTKSVRFQQVFSSTVCFYKSYCWVTGSQIWTHTTDANIGLIAYPQQIYRTNYFHPYRSLMLNFALWDVGTYHNLR